MWGTPAGRGRNEGDGAGRPNPSGCQVWWDLNQPMRLCRAIGEAASLLEKMHVWLSLGPLWAALPWCRACLHLSFIFPLGLIPAKK